MKIEYPLGAPQLGSSLPARRISRKPSRQLATSTGVGASIGAIIELASAAYGLPLPPGTGAAVAAGAVGLMHYLQGKGRKPAAPE